MVFWALSSLEHHSGIPPPNQPNKRHSILEYKTPKGCVMNLKHHSFFGSLAAEHPSYPGSYHTHHTHKCQSKVKSSQVNSNKKEKPKDQGYAKPLHQLQLSAKPSPQACRPTSGSAPSRACPWYSYHSTH